MKIVAGKYKGKQLFVPKGLDVRPTLERTREALFSILYSMGINFADIDVLDVFAGTGSFGFEALSRGAKTVTFIDIDTKPVLKNAALFEKEKNKIEIIKSDIAHIKYRHKKYNLIFMDAPYGKGLTELAVQSLIKKDLIAENALCLIETRKDENISFPECFELCDQRIYALNKIEFFWYKK
ncbi:MAG: 16S rRNA (guanine(966)-N(2))-methyltransferase RsmD [Alphaproteobacteria bacterium]|nr:16S rRNA (guanine(966)-N(2))-methyltransferase RsmD [Alphaproteobacteria bacterium]